MSVGAPFRLGINYWPARTAMGWWTSYDAIEVATDFARIAACGFDSVRIFLTWEAFQPSRSRVDATMLAHLVSTLDAASNAGLAVMPTLFTGHMSGVNWLPGWALADAGGDPRFRVVSGAQVVTSHAACWYSDASIVEAQAALAREVAAASSGHSALWAWDLGNENSNCAIPPDTAHAREWLMRITGALRDADPGALITMGLHMEDLEQDRKLGPLQASEVCDFLTMHGYPGYAVWAEGPTDERVLPFLARLTRWLSGGADVLFAEFGIPTHDGDRQNLVDGPLCVPLVSQQTAAEYIDRALVALHACASTGAMLWCYADYAEAIWSLPPLDEAVHERCFGLWRADGTAKPAVAVVKAFAAQGVTTVCEPLMPDETWIDIDAVEYYQAPGRELPRLYRRYCQALAVIAESANI